MMGSREASSLRPEGSSRSKGSSGNKFRTPRTPPSPGDQIVAIIPAWNARTRLPAVLASLFGQVAAVVIVDNGSTDGSVEWLRGIGEGPDPPPAWPALHLIANPDNRGYPAAVNQGLKRAAALDASAVLLVNDDARFDPGAVAALAEALQADPQAGAATARLVYAERPDVLNGAGGLYLPGRAWAALRGAGEADLGQYDHHGYADYPSGAASLLRWQSLESVGPLDEAWYLYYEDVDWGLRAAAMGWSTRYVAGARVSHLGSAGTARDPARRRYYNVRNRLRFARRHAPPAGRLRAWLETLRLACLQPLRWLWPRRRRDATAVLLGIADHLRGRYGRSDRFG